MEEIRSEDRSIKEIEKKGCEKGPDKEHNKRLEKQLAKERLEKETERFCQEPGGMVGKMDRGRFEHYCDRWKEDKDIHNLWRESGSVFYALIHQDSWFQDMLELLPGQIDVFVQTAGKVRIPFLIQELLELAVRHEDGWEYLLQVMELADSCGGKEIFSGQIENIFAPMALDVLMGYIRSAHIEHKVEFEQSLEMVREIADVLGRRQDGFYLAYHYVRHLLWKEPGIDGLDEVLEVFCRGFYHQAQEKFWADGTVVLDGLGCGRAQEVYDFKRTGLLNGEPEDDLLLSFRAVMYFTDGRKKELYEAYETVFAHGAQSFYTNDFKPHLKHIDIADLLLAQEDPVCSWKKILDMANAAMHRMSFGYYEERCAQIRYHISFMWGVGLRMLDYLCGEEDCLEQARGLWQELWGSGLEYVRRFARYIDDYHYQFLSTLICYKYVYFGKLDSQPFRSMFEDIANMPIVVLMAVKQLVLNGADIDDFLSDREEGFFKGACLKAEKLAEGRVQYQWVYNFWKKPK